GYRYFMENLEKRKWETLLTPPTELNYDLVHEFYANALPIEGVCYTFCSFVRGRAMSFARDEISQYFGNPLTLQRGEIYAYQNRVSSKKWKLDLVGWQIDVAQIISNEIQNIAISGFTL
ncbi:hypothetical protein RYX36_025524, partial [Vicia faba]